MQQKLNTEEVEALVAMAGSDPLAVAVHGINLTLAHHAAWTEERFDKLNERFDTVDKTLRSLDAAIDHRVTRVERNIELFEIQIDSHARKFRYSSDLEELAHTRLTSLESARWEIHSRLGGLEAANRSLVSGQVKLQASQGKLLERQGNLEAGQNLIVDEMRQLSSHIQTVLNFAVKGELKADEISE